MLAANRELLDWLRDARGHGAAVEGVEGLFAETLGAGGPAVQVVAEAVAGRWNRLDMLVLNAATLGALSPVPSIDPKDLSRLLTLNVGHGDEVTLRADGEQAEQSLDALAALLEKNLDEEFQER